MLSEKIYWSILIVCLTIFIIVNVIWILPVIRDLAINLITNSIFAIFTVIFLTWIIKARDTRQWNMVEKHILKRVADHLYKLFDMTYQFFLEPIEMPEEKELSKKLDGSKDSRLFYGGVAAYCANHGVKLGESGIDFIMNTSQDGFEAVDSFFEDKGDFFEHVISEYSRFLPPELMQSILEIEDSIDLIRNTCLGILVDAEVRGYLKQTALDSLAKMRKKDVETAISTMSKEIYKVNNTGLGFYCDK